MESDSDNTEVLKGALVRSRARAIDYRRAFNTKQGTRVLHDLMDQHFCLRNSFVPGDMYATAFQEGQRGVVLRILQLLKTDPEELKNKIEEIDKNVREARNTYDI